MSSRSVFFVAVLFLAVVSGGYAFDPVVVAGVDLDLTQYPSSLAVDLRQRLAFSWRERLARGGFVALNGQIVHRLPLDGGGSSDSERLDVQLAIPVGPNETAAGLGIESSFVQNGNRSAMISPRWNADYRILNDRGWFGVLSNGLYRWSAAGGDTALVQRVGVGHSSSASIRFGLDSNLLAGFESWPGYAIVDATGIETGTTRRDLTVRLDTTAEGLWGYFTTWAVSGVAESRFSNANRYLDSAGEFEPDSESRVAGRLSGSVRTSPTRHVSLSGLVELHGLRYLERVARDESGAPLGDKLSVLSLTGGVTADYSPLANLFLVGSLSAGGSFSREEARRGSNVQVRVGVEYSF